LNKKERGAAAEQLALEFLMREGYQPVSRNYRCRQGEIDLIVFRESDLVFVEVRSKSRRDYGMPVETIDYQKQRKISYTATLFLQQNPRWNCFYGRFDVISVLWDELDEKTKQPRIEWIQDAFQ